MVRIPSLGASWSWAPARTRAGTVTWPSKSVQSARSRMAARAATTPRAGAPRIIFRT